ncbi:CLUMA_CG011753, isoform A [Clunio marinus]|uniref:CLUMA_CG011753, isoform A n=1 Tax=Clunio marinus TaxID=568069 RepID=A0A1J1IF57_9DIPT|nr:CLUMA_CG011753, isoform A [Clunio marinus]
MSSSAANKVLQSLTSNTLKCLSEFSNVSEIDKILEENFWFVSNLTKLAMESTPCFEATMTSIMLHCLKGLTSCKQGIKLAEECDLIFVLIPILLEDSQHEDIKINALKCFRNCLLIELLLMNIEFEHLKAQIRTNTT